MDNALVRRPPEKQGGIPLFKYERTVHKSVYVRQKHSKMRVRTDLLYGKSRPAPDSLGSFGFNAAGKFREGLHLKEWVASAEGNIGDSVSLDDFHNLVDAHPFAVGYIPGLGVVAALAVVGAAGAVYRCAQTRAVGHGLLHDFEYGNFIRVRHGL